MHLPRANKGKHIIVSKEVHADLKKLAAEEGSEISKVAEDLLRIALHERRTPKPVPGPTVTYIHLAPLPDAPCPEEPKTEARDLLPEEKPHVTSQEASAEGQAKPL